MARNQSEKTPTIEGVHPEVLRFLQSQAMGTVSQIDDRHRPEYRSLGHMLRIAYRSAYKEFLDAQKSK